MSEDHIHRKRDIFTSALPPEDSKAYRLFMETTGRSFKENPKFDKLFKEHFKKVNEIVDTQINNGAGLPMDTQIRGFLSEYNHRNFQYGLNSMPSSFNILEGFFKYLKKDQLFELLEEENHILSLYDFIDFITSADFVEDPMFIRENLVEDLIYHYDISSDLENLTFTTEDGDRYVIGGVSIVRRGSEVIIFLLTGQETDTNEETTKLIKKGIDFKALKGKENIEPDPEKKMEAVKLFGKTNYWQTLAFCRIDIEKLTIDTRYIEKDFGNMYQIITDDITGMQNRKGEFLVDVLEEHFKKMSIEIAVYSPLFEFATKCLYLPYYFNSFEDNITEEEHPTKLAEIKKKNFFSRKDRTVPSKYIIKSRTVWSLNRNIHPNSDIIFFGENDFKIEKTGYWKNLEYNKVGNDKNGNPIHNKTWIQKTLSWYEKDKQTLTIDLSQGKSTIRANSNEGFIYIMRNASHDIDIFKIGLTTRDSKTRAKELSATTGSADKFLLANEWKTKDCVLAEKLIHEELKEFRINDSREFFRIQYEKALATIIKIVTMVNSL